MVEELLGLTQIDSSGQAAMEIVNGYDAKYKHLEGNFSMVVTRKKTPTLFKARLVSRCDLASEDDLAFASAPTANRVSIRTAICISLMFGLRIGNVDVTQAFLQSGTVAFRDRQVICVPGYVELPDGNRVMEGGKSRSLMTSDFKVLTWEEWIRKKSTKADFPRALLAGKPLYGGRDAPLRWFITVSRILRMDGANYDLIAAHFKKLPAIVTESRCLSQVFSCST